MIKICNLRFEKIKYAYDVRVDRFNKVLGNKFYMDCELNRDLVCDKYETWFNEQIKNKNEIVLNELRKLYLIHKRYGKLRLFCWCFPKRCHALTICNFLNKYI